MSAVRKIKLGSQGLEVAAQGLGCMGMSAFYGSPKPEPEMLEVLKFAIDSGITFFDTSDVYGPHTNEILIGKALKEKEKERAKVQIGTKFGVKIMDEQTKTYLPKPEVHGEPAYVRAACEGSLKRLGVDCIDLYYQHRIDTKIPIEITMNVWFSSFSKVLWKLCCSGNVGIDVYMGELKKLVEEGKIKYVGLSEVSSSTIRRAHAVHPLTAIQLEWSLFEREVEEDIVPTCRELGIGIVAYSPLGLGFLSKGPKLVENMPDNDFRKTLPKFQGENMEHNKIMFERVQTMAEKKGCTPSQLALAWMHHQGNNVCPIPGTTKIENLKQNIGALSVELTPDDMAELESIAAADSVKGARFNPSMNTWKNTSTPPLSSWTSE